MKISVASPREYNDTKVQNTKGGIVSFAFFLTAFWNAGRNIQEQFMKPASSLAV